MKKLIRIRYFDKEDNGILVSNPMFAQTEMVTVHINLKKLTYSIFTDSDKVSFCHPFTSLPKAKKEIKLKLEELGVKFLVETRVRTPKVSNNNVDENVQEQ